MTHFGMTCVGRALVATALVAGCASSSAPASDAGATSDGADATDDAPTVVTACAQIDAAGLTTANIDAFVARWSGTRCRGPLAGGDPSLLQQCRYGGDLLVCGQSSGLRWFGCSCASGAVLDCIDGVELARQQEERCRDGGPDGR